MRNLIFLLCLCAGSIAHAAGEKLFFYELNHARGKVWLMGSIHLARPDIYPLRSEITEAFRRAESLVVEVDISGAGQFAAQQLLLERGMYPPGESVEQHLSAATWSALQKSIRQFGLPAEIMSRFRPAMLITTLGNMHMMKMGMSPEYGIDRHFLALAQGNKEVLELESIEQQAALLFDFSDQELLVKQSLEQFDQMDLLMNQLISAWKRGDELALKRLVIDEELARDSRYRKIHRMMFDDRNRAMTEKIVGYMRKGGSYFVVVGAGHLIGDQGIVALLKQRGYDPRQL